MAVSSMRPASSLVATMAALVAVAALTGPAAATGNTGQVTVFWGRNKAEGTLREACDAGTYTIVVISFLSVFGNGNKPPTLDLSGHPIAGIGDDIKHCQSKSIMVFLSIGGFGDKYSLPSAKAATDLADYLWYAYFPAPDPRHGLDFFLEHGSPAYYDVLAKRLWSYNKQFRARTPVQLSATPRCAFPDNQVQRVLATGLVTRINVRFYGDGRCAAYWQQEWDKWTAAFPDSGIYVGLPVAGSRGATGARKRSATCAAVTDGASRLKARPLFQRRVEMTRPSSATMSGRGRRRRRRRVGGGAGGSAWWRQPLGFRVLRGGGDTEAAAAAKRNEAGRRQKGEGPGASGVFLTARSHTSVLPNGDKQTEPGRNGA